MITNAYSICGLSSEIDVKKFSQSEKYLNSLKLFKICQMFIKYLVAC